jgi:hypothetical protein
LIVLPLSLYRVENRVCLSYGVHVAVVTWWAVMRIVTGVVDLVQRTEDGRTGRVLGGRTIGRSGDTVCGLHRACGDESTNFLVEAQKQGQRFVSGLASKPLERFFRFDFKTGGDSFLRFGHKTGGDGFS